MRLTVGSTAPSFDVVDFHGQRLTLAALRGQRVVLAFHRFVACPLCNLAIRQLRDVPPSLTGRFRMINFFESSPENLAGALEAWGDMPFSCVADPQHAVYDAYGVETSAWGALKSMSRIGMVRASLALEMPKVPADGQKTRQPAGFSIGVDGRLEAVHYGADAGDHVTRELVLRWLSPEVPAASVAAVAR